MKHYKIGRVAVKNKHLEKNYFQLLEKALMRINAKIDYLVLFAGIFSDCFSTTEFIHDYELTLKELEDNPKFWQFVEKRSKLVVQYFFNSLKHKQILKDKVRYLLYSYATEVENDQWNGLNFFALGLTALIDLESEEIISLSTDIFMHKDDRSYSMRMLDFSKKFIQLGDDKILILTHYDLEAFNIFNGKTEDYFDEDVKLAFEFLKIFEQEKPNIILHSKSWLHQAKDLKQAWNYINSHYNFVEHYASSFKHGSCFEKPKDKLEDILVATKKGSVLDIII